MIDKIKKILTWIYNKVKAVVIWVYKKIKDKALHYWSNHKIETIVFIVLVVALIIK